MLLTSHWNHAPYEELQRREVPYCSIALPALPLFCWAFSAASIVGLSASFSISSSSRRPPFILCCRSTWNSPSVSIPSSHGSNSISFAVARLDPSSWSIGSRNFRKWSASSSGIRYFSVKTAFRGQYFSREICRSSAVHLFLPIQQLHH